MINTARHRLLLLAFLVSLMCLPLQAQQPTGTIIGLILDPSGAAVRGAGVTARSPATGLSRQTTSGADGSYVFPLLPAATYEVTAEAAGFKRTEQKNISLNADITLTVNLKLQVGGLAETITVEVGGAQIDTSTGALRQVIEERQVAELPLVDRNPARLLLLAAGTSDQTNTNVTSGGGEQSRTIARISYPGSMVFSSNGGRGDGLNYVLDGGNNRDSYLNLNNPVPNPYALQEFVVQINNVGAQHGSATGGVATMVTKSGSNHWHGNVFEFLRNDALNAAPFFNNTRGGGKDVLKRNQMGGAVGGPLATDRLFIFGSYQGLLIRKAATRTRYRVFTDAQRAGIFDAVPYPVNPVSAALLEYIPHADNQRTGEVFLHKRQDEHENQYLAKLDYVGAKSQLFGKYFDSRYIKETVPGVKDNIFQGIGGFDFIYKNVAGGLNTAISATLLNNLTMAFHNIQTFAFGASPIGMNELNPKVAGFKEINMTFGGGLSSINFLGRDREITRRSWQLTDNAHWIRGRHDMAFGGDLTRLTLHHVSHFRQAGFYTFTGPKNFILGDLAKLIQGGGEFTDKTYWNRSLYVNDHLRVSNQLTVDVGLRWDPFDPPVDKDKKASCFAPGRQSRRFPNAPVGLIFAGEAGCPDAGFAKAWINFAPRLGFAYNVGGHNRTSVRGGIGLAYQPPFLEALNNMVAIPPFSPQVAIFATKFDDPYGFKGIPNPFPQKFGPRAGSPDDTFNSPAIVTSYATHWKPPRAWSYNLTIEHQLFTDMMARVSYVGLLGRKLGFNTDFNFPRSLE
ncbi:MAG: TonB-dependent receptor, partial [Acidobacteria bacterium]|nr:TonB-dependent receptor [Acidobacteriota bacterium]